MLFFIRYDGEERRVQVESRNNQIFVKFENEPEEAVALEFHGNECLYLRDGKVFSGNISGDKGEFTVWNPRGNLHFSIESEYRRIAGKLRGQDLQAEHNVYAKMPGKIAKISIKAGDVLTKGDPVLVMEAMKMENEIRSPISGTVIKLLIAEGQAVETGALLVEIEPTEA